MKRPNLASLHHAMRASALLSVARGAHWARAQDVALRTASNRHANFERMTFLPIIFPPMKFLKLNRKSGNALVMRLPTERLSIHGPRDWWRRETLAEYWERWGLRPAGEGPQRRLAPGRRGIGRLW